MISLIDIRTPSRSTWDDEEMTPLRSRAWDLPSPARSVTDDIRSERRLEIETHNLLLTSFRIIN